MMDTTAPFVVLTTANYHCDEGFVLSGGNEVRTCIGADDESPNGVWDGVAPTCERKVNYRIPMNGCDSLAKLMYDVSTTHALYNTTSVIHS